ncbi:MAG: hypothetical protein B6U88_00365 [Candidatus Aenigmarchaeota archaeon ex4484_56]|nr:MAG: hypothetical protein B6U88_00365 [Candidatus Aenigmarchaeota archaeon ex4484_56]
MCLGIKGKILKIKNNFAVVDFGGVKKEICIALTPDVKINDRVIVHAGFSIRIVK